MHDHREGTAEHKPKTLVTFQ